MRILILLVEDTGVHDIGTIMLKMEDQYVSEINNLKAQRFKVIKRLASIRSKLVEQESELIRLNILIEKKSEELRSYRSDTVDSELDARDLEIIRFKTVLPNIMRKI
jgi:hypothetical protein